MATVQRKVCIAIITNGRPDMTLQSCVSVLNLQTELMTSHEGFQGDLRFFKNHGDAIDHLFVNSDLFGMFIIGFDAGVNGRFAIKAATSDKDITIGVHPMGAYDWDRIKEKITSNSGEHLAHTGIIYNVTLGGVPDKDGYARVAKIKDARVLFVKRAAIAEIIDKHQGLIDSSGTKTSIAIEGIFDGKFMTWIDRFMSLYGKPFFADTEHQGVFCAPSEFTGTVGNRTALR